MYFNFHVMIIPVNVYNADTDIWNKNWVRLVDYSSFERSARKVAPFPALAIEKNWWSVFLQKNWFSFFLKLLIVIWCNCMSFPEYCMECFGKCKIPYEKIMQILLFWRKLSWRPDVGSFRCSEIGTHDNQGEVSYYTSRKISSTIILCYMYSFLHCVTKSSETARYGSLSQITSLKVLLLDSSSWKIDTISYI